MEAGALVARERLQRRGVRLEWFTVAWHREIVGKWRAAGVRMAEDVTDRPEQTLAGLTVLLSNTTPLPMSLNVTGSPGGVVS